MEVKGYIAKPDIIIQEEFKGEILDTPKKFPRDLGAEHPFNFEDLEKVYKKVGIVAGVINKFTESIAGDFSIKAKNPNTQAILDSFIKDTNFSIVIRSWIREGLLKGNGFIELDLKDNNLRVLNANQMYVKRNKKGEVIEYNQFTGALNKYVRGSTLLIPFKPNEIAHLPINKIPGDPYGIGIIYSSERIIENIVTYEQELLKLMKRKAGAPIHVKVGNRGESVQSQDIDDFSNKLQYMNNKTEWVTDANVEMLVLSFGEIGKNLMENLMYNYRMFLASVEMPEVMMGSGQLNEGIGKVQLETLSRKVNSVRALIESVIEEKIFKPILNSNSLDEDVQFIWEEQSEESKNLRIDSIKNILGVFGISDNLKRSLEIELAILFGLEELEKFLPKPEKDLEKEREEEETKIPQPEVPGAKPSAKEIVGDLVKEHICKVHESEDIHEEMSIKEFVNIQEIQGFNYSDFLIKILQALKRDKFEELKAKTEEDIKNGLLSQSDIKKVRIILKDGFKENKTVREIQNELKDNVEFKDRYSDDKLILSKERRPNIIARTETVRLANIGLKDLFKENGIEKIRFLAAVSDRTCPICESLNGQVFNMNELQTGTNQPPIHSNCFLHRTVNVMTEEGEKNINLIRIGDKVLTHKGRYRPVIKILDDNKRYNGEAIRIQYKGKVIGESNKRNSITVTPEHPFLTSRGWIQARDLELNDNLFILCNYCQYCGNKIPFWKKSCSSKCSMTSECKEKISIKNSGINNGMFGITKENHPRWNGGKIWWRGKEWDETKLKARNRDKFKCQECGMTEDDHIKRYNSPLHVHHINPYRYSKNNSLENLKTLCVGCHSRIEGTTRHEILNKGGAEFMIIPILKIEQLKNFKGERKYNFSVEEDESYVAEGIINHNCRCSLLSVIE